MTLLSEYYVPGLHIEDRSIKVPLDWTGHEPGHGFDGESISLFYRVVTAPEHKAYKLFGHSLLLHHIVYMPNKLLLPDFRKLRIRILVSIGLKN